MNADGALPKVQSGRRLEETFIIKAFPACLRCPPSVMNKFSLQQQVLKRLAEDLLQAEDAVRVAHETATHAENIAENKYDTLGLEAAYLAAKSGAPKPSARRWPSGANSTRVPTTPAKGYSSARWSAWSIPTTSSNSSFSARMGACLLYTSPSPRDGLLSRMPSSA